MIAFVPLTGFLGAGKTTTMTGAALALQTQGRNVAVITNDQGVELVDTRLARSKLDAVSEITGGCFCCKFDDLVEAIVGLVRDDDGIDTIIAEAVGSCTDLQATVVRPLRRYYQDQVTVAPLTTVVDPLRFLAFERAAARGEPESDLSYLFRQQLIEADIIAVNKLDTITGDQAEELLTRLRAAYPSATVVGYCAANGDHLPELLAAWEGPSGNQAVDLGVDYDRYAAAEAQLAWMNQELQLSAGDGFDPNAWAHTMLDHLSAWATEHEALIGHAKVTIDLGEDNFAKLSVTGTGEGPVVDRAASGTATSARAVINARVACEPDELDFAVQRAVTAADDTHHVTSSATSPVSFKPGYPRPIHRLTAASA